VALRRTGVPTAVSIRRKLHWLHPRALVYLATAAAMLLSLSFLRSSNREVSPSVTLAVDGIGLVLALIIGALALAYFRGFKARSLLFVSMGCIGSGLIDLARLVYVLTYGARIPPDVLNVLNYWSTAAARFYLAAMLLAGWRAAEGRISAAPWDTGRAVAVAQIGGVGFLLISGLLTQFFLHPERIPDTRVPQLLPVISAIVYVGVFGIFLARGDWKRYPFQHWFSLALILLAGSDICLVSALPPSGEYLAFASDVLQVAAYGLVLAALLFSTSNLLSQASNMQLERRVSEIMSREGWSDVVDSGGGASTERTWRVNQAVSFELDLISDRLRFNEAALQMFANRSPVDDMQRLLEKMHPEDRSRVLAALGRSRDEGVLFKQEFRALVRGEYRWLEAIAGVESVTGIPVRLLGYLDDISERVEAARALEASIEAQRKSNSDLQMFAHIVSHDLQEPLRMVSSFMTLLKRRYAEDLNDEAREFIQFAVEGAARMRDLLDGLLSYSRVQSAGMSFAETALEDPLRDALANLAMLLRESAASINVGLLPVLPCDAAQMMQLFQNLLSNAIKFRRPVPLSIRISSRRMAERWVVDVKDNGIGIDPAHFQRIFQIFQRVNGREFPGTGVGLAVCSRIMERHGGHMEVASQVGEGSTFSLYF
jgi:signal transduction histidine kinase